MYDTNCLSITYNHISDRMAGSVSLQAAYGYTVPDTGRDQFIDLAEKTMEDFSRFATPGLFLADLIPVLRHIPSWFPGAGFQKEAAITRQRIRDLADLPIKFVEEQIVS